jgi:hypothetical protein
VDGELVRAIRSSIGERGQTFKLIGWELRAPFRFFPEFTAESSLLSPILLVLLLVNAWWSLLSAPWSAALRLFLGRNRGGAVHSEHSGYKDYRYNRLLYLLPGPL